MNFTSFCDDLVKLGGMENGDIEGWLSYFKFIKSRNHYTYDDVSTIVGVPVRTLQNWCCGVREPPDYVLPLVCFALVSCEE